MTTIPLAPPLLAGSSDLPGDLVGPSNQRCSAGRLPIWSCSVRGFACHPCYHGRGALLPHLFTLTRLRTRSVRRRAVCFLCHFPSSHPDRALPGALPCGVRTFLSTFAPCDATVERPSSSLRRSNCTAGRRKAG